MAGTNVNANKNIEQINPRIFQPLSRSASQKFPCPAASSDNQETRATGVADGFVTYCAVSIGISAKQISVKSKINSEINLLAILTVVRGVLISVPSMLSLICQR